MNRVGAKGQLVIAKEIRDKLGIEPGWSAVQRLVDDHVEIYFIPPAHNRSLLGILRPYISDDVPEIRDEDWPKVKARAWQEAARERTRRMSEDEDESLS